jgi:plasmid maintenance system antidote protein VapI
MAINKTRTKDFDVEIGLPENETWDKAKLTQIKTIARQLHGQRSPERKIKNQILAIRYQMEEYLESKDVNTFQSINDFVKLYLGVLNISFKKFALVLETTDGNLKKYMSGERKFNIDLAMKFGHFFHTPAELWLNISIKNELMELKNEKKAAKKYEKYNYEKILEFN